MAKAEAARDGYASPRDSLAMDLTIDDIDALVGPATPHFAFQIRARVREAIAGLPEDDAVRRYGEEKIALLDDLGYASSKAEHAEGADAAQAPRLGADPVVRAR